MNTGKQTLDINDLIREWFNPNYILRYLKSMRYTAFLVNSNDMNLVEKLHCIIHKIRYQKLGLKLGFTIGVNSFGYGLVIPHHGTIVINSDTIAGNYCVLHTCTCIGGKGKRISNGLYMSTGSQIMGGNIELGDNISIAANSMVNISFKESGLLLVGNPAQLKRFRKAWYLEDGDRYYARVKLVEAIRNK